MQVVDDRLSVGAIIFDFVTDTHPPKPKYYIIVGITEDKIALGTVYINSEINPNVFRNEVVRKLNVPLSKADNPFLSHDSYIDCSGVQEKLFADVWQCINSGDKKYGYVNNLPPQILQMVIETLDSAYTISTVIKKKYGIRKS